MIKTNWLRICFVGVLASLGCNVDFSRAAQQPGADSRTARRSASGGQSETRPLPPDTPQTIRKMLENADGQVGVTTMYDPAYVVLEYPNGDVPIERGVCTDVVIRGMRAAGVDLQKEVHEDMKGSFASYPKKWGLKRPDKNIDHRRVPNLDAYFTRKGKSLKITDRAEDYKPGDIVAWKLDGGLDHIGIVSNQRSTATGNYLIIHNIGRGAQAEDVLFEWKITGHYRYF